MKMLSTTVVVNHDVAPLSDAGTHYLPLQGLRDPGIGVALHQVRIFLADNVRIAEAQHRVVNPDVAQLQVLLKKHHGGAFYSQFHAQSREPEGFFRRAPFGHVPRDRQDLFGVTIRTGNGGHGHVPPARRAGNRGSVPGESADPTGAGHGHRHLGFSPDSAGIPKVAPVAPLECRKVAHFHLPLTVFVHPEQATVKGQTLHAIRAGLHHAASKRLAAHQCLGDCAPRGDVTRCAEPLQYSSVRVENRHRAGQRPARRSVGTQHAMLEFEQTLRGNCCCDCLSNPLVLVGR